MLDVPARLRIWRCLRDAGEPLTVEEIVARTGLSHRSTSERLYELANGKPAALQVQRVMKGVYQAIPE